jgi:hypothetical protein
MHRGIRRCSASPPRGGNDDFNNTTVPTNQVGGRTLYKKLQMNCPHLSRYFPNIHLLMHYYYFSFIDQTGVTYISLILVLIGLQNFF